MTAREHAGNWDRLMEVRDGVLKSLETARNEKLIGAPLEARVHLSANGDLYPLLEQLRRRTARPVHRLAGGCATQPIPAMLSVDVERASGDKCERCWKYTHDVGSDPASPPSAPAAPPPWKRSFHRYNRDSDVS